MLYDTMRQINLFETNTFKYEKNHRPDTQHVKIFPNPNQKSEVKRIQDSQ